MVKKALLLMSAAACLGVNVANAQKVCGSDEAYQKYKADHPEVAIYEAQMEAQIKEKLQHINLSKYARVTTSDSEQKIVYDVPLVFHIIHNYDQEYVSDNDIFAAVADINTNYAKMNADTSDVIAPYKGFIPGTIARYIGKANIRFHLPTKDPSGNPTHGITRRRSYKSYNAGDDAKFDQWSPDSYLNIWIINTFSGDHTGAAAYAYQPPAAASNPYIDGVICLYSYMNSDKTLTHEIGHTLNLAHPWGNTNQPAIACGDDDVDDTPPTKGHNPSFCAPADLKDTTCSNGYMKQYSFEQFLNLYDTSWAVAPPKIWIDSTHWHYDSTTTFIVNYPDTVNSQNIMDYTYCSRMFTYGQVQRMRAALTSTVANRNHLYNDTNLLATGALGAWPDLAPTADFSLGKIAIEKIKADKVFGCANTYSFSFTDRSWNDTITSRTWTFSNGATVPTSTAATVNNTFTQPGWVDVTLNVTGNNTASSSVTRKAVYVADPVAMNPDGYLEEFTPSATLDKYPMFNYFNNDYKWEVVNNVGCFDQSSIRYRNFDTRVPSQNQALGTPQGDYDDFFTPGFDLSGSQYVANCNLNFMSSGAFRTTSSPDMRDSLEIWYSTSCANTWILLTTITKADLANKGVISTDYTPGGPGDWKQQSINIPPAARLSEVFFRFRYKPGSFTSGANGFYGIGSGNNFYIDRLGISSFGLGVNNVELEQNGMTLAPNPTTGGTNIYIKGGNGLAQVVVTDVAGKVVYRTQQQLSGNATQIEIPASNISVKGMYLVQVITPNKSQTEKLVVY